MVCLFGVFKKYLFIYLAAPGLSCSTWDLRCHVWDLLVAACKTFSCGGPTLSCSMWDLDPRAGVEPVPPALGAWSLSHWTTREVPDCF